MKPLFARALFPPLLFRNSVPDAIVSATTGYLYIVHLASRSKGRCERRERIATGLFTLVGIHLYDHVHALLPMKTGRLHVFAMQEHD
jgi:hypothetical protein